MASEFAPTFELVRERRDHFQEALRLLLGQYCDVPIERWRATRRLVEVIGWVQGALIDPAEPPRIPDVRRLLDTVESASRTLTSRLEELDELTVDLIYSRPQDLLNPSKLPEYLERARICWAHVDPRFNESELLESLFALQQACRLIRETFLDERHPSARLPTVGFTNPKLHLVTLAATLFAEFRPADLRATWRGPFHNFCRALYQLITGQDPEAPGVGLRRYVDFVAPRMRRLRELSDRRIHRLIAASSPYFRDTSGQRLYRLSAEMDAAWTEIQDGPFHRRERSE